MTSLPPDTPRPNGDSAGVPDGDGLAAEAMVAADTSDDVDASDDIDDIDDIDDDDDDEDDEVDLDDLAVSAYIDGVASPLETARVDADPALRRRLDQFRAVASLLAADTTARSGTPAGWDPAADAVPAGERRGLGAAGGGPDPTLGAALDRIRAGALEAASMRPDDAPTSPPPPSVVDRLGRRRAHRARWVVQVAGLAAAALVAVGAAALLRSPGDDRPTAAETAAAEVDRGRQGATGEETLSASRAAGDASASAAAAAAGSSRADGSGGASISPPSLGVHATVGDLLASLDQRVGEASSPPAAPSAASREGSDAPASSTDAAPTTTVPLAAASGPPSCPTQGGDVLGTALVGGRALLVLETTGPGGERRLVGVDLVGCTPVFDQPR